MRVVKKRGRFAAYSEMAEVAGPGILPCVKWSRLFRRAYFDIEGKCTLQEFLQEEINREVFCSLLKEVITLCKSWEATGVNYRKFSWNLSDVYVTAGSCHLQFLYLPWMAEADNQDIRRFFQQLCKKVKVPLLERGDWMEEFQDRMLRQSCFTLFMLEPYLEAFGNRYREEPEETAVLEGYGCWKKECC